MDNPQAPFHPIIYVRGYAMSQGEIDATSADPFCGFNVGSTVYRAVADRSRTPRKFVFESPLVRLASDFGYRDVYEGGYDIVDADWNNDGEQVLSSRSIVIHRYYDEASSLFGGGPRPPIEAFARALGELIVRVRDLVCANRANGIAPDDFRCYLVAHSMGGLVCRALLQNDALDEHGACAFVDKFFTYATPHNGIELAGFNVPSWLGKADMDNFNRKRMAEYLDLKDVYEKTGRVDWMPEDRMPAERVFCLVGTNRQDYDVALGASRTFVGHGSDGLVRIENATLTALRADGSAGAECAKAFVYRAHSGTYGIVNSEDAYQNLVRFLFGDVRVDIHVDLDDVRLPDPVRQAQEAGRQVDALYQIEMFAAPRGKLWYLTRRMAEEDSVACIRHADWRKDPRANGTRFLSSVFLANRARVNPARPSLAYGMTLGVRVPDYEIERRLWVDQHYEGGYLFRDALIVEMVPPQQPGAAWDVRYAWQGQAVKLPDQSVRPRDLGDGQLEVRLPFGNDSVPGVSGHLRLLVSGWNRGASAAAAAPPPWNPLGGIGQAMSHGAGLPPVPA